MNKDTYPIFNAKKEQVGRAVWSGNRDRILGFKVGYDCYNVAGVFVGSTRFIDGAFAVINKW